MRLLLSGGGALSLDNLLAGFALGSCKVGVLAGALVFGLASAAMSLAGQPDHDHEGSLLVFR